MAHYFLYCDCIYDKDSNTLYYPDDGQITENYRLDCRELPGLPKAIGDLVVLACRTTQASARTVSYPDCYAFGYSDTIGSLCIFVDDKTLKIWNHGHKAWMDGTFYDREIMLSRLGFRAITTERAREITSKAGAALPGEKQSVSTTCTSKPEAVNFPLYFSSGNKLTLTSLIVLIAPDHYLTWWSSHNSWCKVKVTGIELVLNNGTYKQISANDFQNVVADNCVFMPVFRADINRKN